MSYRSRAMLELRSIAREDVDRRSSVPRIYEETPKGGAWRKRYVTEGMVYGELTVVGKSDIKNVWELRCKCGGTALKTAGELNLRYRKGKYQACAACLAERRTDLKAIASDLISSAYLQQYEDTGSLWDGWQTKSLQEMILNDLEAQFGPRQMEYLRPDDMVFSSDLAYGKKRSGAATMDEVDDPILEAKLRVRAALNQAKSRARYEARKEAMARVPTSELMESIRSLENPTFVPDWAVGATGLRCQRYPARGRCVPSSRCARQRARKPKGIATTWSCA